MRGSKSTITMNDTLSITDLMRILHGILIDLTNLPRILNRIIHVKAPNQELIGKSNLKYANKC